MANELEFISTEPVKEKLKNLKKYISDADDFLYDFGKHLANRLNEEVNSLGFNIQFEYSAKKFTENYPAAIYTLLRNRMPEITKATCPSEFAEEAIKIHESLNSKI